LIQATGFIEGEEDLEDSKNGIGIFQVLFYWFGKAGSEEA
jgi:hypothetical protein